MKNKRKVSKKRIFFNASVILAGFKSPFGGSAKILSWCKSKKIEGLVSELVVDEVIRNAQRMGFDYNEISLLVENIFDSFETAPNAETVKKYQKIVIDFGDAHVLASCHEAKADFLVTLDKKHLLILQNKIKWVRIVSPAELLVGAHGLEPWTSSLSEKRSNQLS